MDNIEVIEVQTVHGQTTVYYRYTLDDREFETSVGFNPDEVTLDSVLKKIGVRIDQETTEVTIPDEVKQLENTSINEQLASISSVEKIAEEPVVDAEKEGLNG